jgi:hypothetical protein
VRKTAPSPTVATLRRGSGHGSDAHFIYIGNATRNEICFQGKMRGFIGVFEAFVEGGAQRGAALRHWISGLGGRMPWCQRQGKQGQARCLPQIWFEFDVSVLIIEPVTKSCNKIADVGPRFSAAQKS